MTITRSPDQEQAVRDAIRAGKVTSEEMPLPCRLRFLPNLDCRAEVPAGWRR